MDTMVQAYSQKIFNGQLPVFDGRRNLYSREPLPIGREKVYFKCGFDIYVRTCATLHSNAYKNKLLLCHIFAISIMYQKHLQSDSAGLISNIEIATLPKIASRLKSQFCLLQLWIFNSIFIKTLLFI